MVIEDPPGFSVEFVAGHADSYSNRSASSEGQEAGSLAGGAGWLGWRILGKPILD